MEHEEAVVFLECRWCWVEAKGKQDMEELEGKMDSFQQAATVRLQISMGENSHRKLTFNSQVTL